MISTCAYVVDSHKTSRSTFRHNFGKCRPIFRILSRTDSERNFLCACDRDVLYLTSTALLH